MRRLKILARAVVLLVCFGALVHSQPRQMKDAAAAPGGSAPAYADSQEGLKSWVEDLMVTMKSGDHEKTASSLASLEIPNHAAWFVKHFGPEEGPRLESKYAELLPRMTDKISQRFLRALEDRMTAVKITVRTMPAESGADLDRAIAEAMTEPLAVYTANGTSPFEKNPDYLGEFVFVDGAFRCVDIQVFLALSTAPPPRIRQGSNVTAGSVLRQVLPNYPAEARRAHVQGNVVLHIIIGTNGAVRDIQPVSGDPVLVDAAIEAVRQWTFTPTLLNGRPVEVDTNVTVTFRL